MGGPNTEATQPFRAEDWWASKAALLMGFVYLFTLWFGISIKAFVPLALCSIAVIIGFASFGYLVNDFFDKEKDKAAGKKNFLNDKSLLFQAGAALLTLCFITLPWLYLPHTKYSFALIAAQISLFFLYSVPLIRLKERGIVGLTADALYAHALPVVFAAYTFMLAGQGVFSVQGISLLFAWQFLSGIRNILIHQAEDKEADIASRTRNFVATLSAQTLYKILSIILVVELLLCVLFFTWLSVINNWFIVCIVVVLLFIARLILNFNRIDFKKMLQTKWRYFPNNVYEKWLPVAYLAILSGTSIYFILFLLLHFALFNIEVYRRVYWVVYPHVYLPLREAVKVSASFIVNYSIYYLLKLFGIDLRKENTSALNYLKNRLKKK